MVVIVAVALAPEHTVLVLVDAVAPSADVVDKELVPQSKREQHQCVGGIPCFQVQDQDKKLISH